MPWQLVLDAGESSIYPILYLISDSYRRSPGRGVIALIQVSESITKTNTYSHNKIMTIWPPFVGQLMILRALLWRF